MLSNCRTVGTGGRVWMRLNTLSHTVVDGDPLRRNDSNAIRR